MAGTYWLTILPETDKLEAGLKAAVSQVSRDAKIAPTVDKAAADKAGRDAGEAIGKGATEAADRAGKDIGDALGRGARESAEKTGRDVGDAIGKGASSEASKTGSAIGAALGTAIGEAAGKAGAVVSREISGAIKSEGIVAGIKKIGSDIGAVASKAGKAIKDSLTGAALDAAPMMANAIEKGVVGGAARARGKGGKGGKGATAAPEGGGGGKLASGAAMFAGVESGASSAVASIGNVSTALDNVSALLGSDNWAGKGISTLSDGLDTALPLITAAGSVATLAGTSINGVSLASKAAAAAQWLWNAAMDANPIGLIITAIAAVVAGLVWFFTKTELGQKIWKAAWEGIKKAVGAAWDFIKGAFDKIMGIITTVIDWIKDHWKLLPILAGPIGIAVSFILTHWDKIKAGVTAVWQWVVDKFTAVVDFVKGLPDKIKKAATGLWDGLKHGLVAVLNWVADKWNALADKVGEWSIPLTDIKVSLPRMPHFEAKATGGMISGPGTGTSDSILARLSNGEFVVNARATAENLPLLTAINNGKSPIADFLKALPGFETGGLTPHSNEIKADIMRFWPQITNIGGYRPPDGYNEHSTGNALDVMIPNWQSPEGKALGDAISGWALNNAEALGLSWVIWQQKIHKPGDLAGQVMQDRGGATQNHLDHVHIFMNNKPNEKLQLVGPSLPKPKTPSGGSASSSGGATSGGKGGDAGPDLSEIGGMIKGALTETGMPQGFSDPSEWPTVKSAFAALNYALGLGGGAGPDPTGGLASGLAGSFGLSNLFGGSGGSGSPQLAAGEFNPATAGGSMGGGGAAGSMSSFAPRGAGGDGATIDNSMNVHFDNTAGEMPTAWQNKLTATQTHRTRTTVVNA